MLPNRNAKQIGDCEGSMCNAMQVEVWLMHGNMLLCADCKKLEENAMMVASERSRDANKFLQTFRAVDEQTKLKTDIFNAKTQPIIEMRAAIEQDESIPSELKTEAATKECERHYLHFRDVLVRDARQRLNELENEMRMWQVAGQEFAGKLSEAASKKFQLFDVNYTPTLVKDKKPKVVKPTTPKLSAKERVRLANDAAAKYGVEASIVLSMMEVRKITAEAAAKILAEDN